MAFELKGALDPALLEKAFAYVWNGSDAKFFRTDLKGGSQSLQKEALIPPFVSLQVEEGKSRGMLTQDFETSFDLTKEAPLRFRLLQVKPNKHLLSLVAHHVALDGWSLARMLEKACAVYNAMKRGEALPELVWEPYWKFLDQYKGQDLTKSLEYWKQKKFVSPLFASSEEGGPGHRAIYILNRKFHTKIKELAKANRVTPFLFLMYCFMRSTGAVMKKQEFVVGVPIASRDFPKSEFVIGNCVNLMPLNVRLGEEADLVAGLAALKEEYIASIGHAALPIQSIQAMHPSDLTQVHFNFEPVIEEPTLQDAVIDFYPFPVSQAERPMIINVNDTKGTYYIEIDFQFKALELVKALTIFTTTERIINKFSALNTPKIDS